MRRSNPAWLSLLALVAACDDPPTFLAPNVPGGPAGVLEGTVTYAGPLPCTEQQHIVGAAILLAFDTRVLPPPEGLGVTAQSLNAVTGEVLFAGIRDRLTFNADGSRWCPKAGTSTTASSSWTIAPLAAGEYEVRGFYDLDGNFDPAFSISNLPTKGDIGGGAIDNAADVLLGKPPIYRRISLGVAQGGALVIPAEGARVGEIAVTLGLPLPLERPVFFPKAVADANGSNKDPMHVVMPADFQLKTFANADPAGTESSFIKLTMGAGVAPNEVDAAAAPPFGLPVKSPPPVLFYSRQDVNGDGKIDANDHVLESTLLPALFPVAAFLKRDTSQQLAAQSSPVVVLQGLTLYKSLLGTVGAPPNLADPATEAIIALRPAVLCIDPMSTSPGTLVITHATDSGGKNKLIGDEGAVKTALKAQFGRDIDIEYACLPQGEYTMNLVYGTGQAWTLPNEAGVCAPSENPKSDTQCGKRARLASQSAVLTIGPPKDAAYCAAHPPPTGCQAH